MNIKAFLCILRAYFFISLNLENGLFQTHPPTKSGKFQIFFFFEPFPYIVFWKILNKLFRNLYCSNSLRLLSNKLSKNERLNFKMYVTMKANFSQNIFPQSLIFIIFFQTRHSWQQSRPSPLAVLRTVCFTLALATTG